MPHEIVVSAGASRKVKDWAKGAKLGDKNPWTGVLTGEKMLSTGATVKNAVVSDVGEAMTAQDVVYAESGAKSAVYPKLQAAIAARAVKVGMPEEDGSASTGRSADAL